jgi:hypothetical protein
VSPLLVFDNRPDLLRHAVLVRKEEHVNAQDGRIGGSLDVVCGYARLIRARRLDRMTANRQGRTPPCKYDWCSINPRRRKSLPTSSKRSSVQGSREDSSGLRGERAQERELLRRELDLAAIDGHVAGDRIHP